MEWFSNLIHWFYGLTWYGILCIASMGIFIVKGLLTFLIGGFDFDVEFDGDVDGELSDLFSLKGLLHFCMGFSSYLSVVGFMNTNSLHKIYEFGTKDYIWSAVFGFIFMVGLYYLYKFLMKANNNTDREINYNGMSGQVMLVDEEKKICRVNVSTPIGVVEVDVNDNNKEVPHSIGDYVTLTYDKETKKYSI